MYFFENKIDPRLTSVNMLGSYLIFVCGIFTLDSSYGLNNLENEKSGKFWSLIPFTLTIT